MAKKLFGAVKPTEPEEMGVLRARVDELGAETRRLREEGADTRTKLDALMTRLARLEADKERSKDTGVGGTGASSSDELPLRAEAAEAL